MKKILLILGDLFTLAAVTVIGFAMHGELGLAYLSRFAAAWLPLALTWFLLAPWFGLFDESVTRNARQLYRPALTVIFAAPLAAVLRGLVLGENIQPIFAIVLAFSNAIGMATWRVLWMWIVSRK